ncbi:disulfide bond formation protein B [Puniceibacterium sp. IMCC21224]|uniref:disulfide bond formation protein B n=1 Tax=Puniceibacterium sp. IMCC21224 TaxID=1618204 RepID=UPI00064DF057|nr:disulfide bond formation protein B [Puniceibacterium sp. IMCC21224]KMK67032.1 disulfide bond formation protein DsbB [Puniceibacterium sp. IMCC21224]
MTRKTLILLAMAGSAALLMGALGFQFLGEMPPCKLCYWQRYPHVAAVIAGLAALAGPGRVFPALGGLAAAATAGIGIYHTGVERGWWEGPTTCTSGPVSGLSADNLMNQIMNAPLVRCDEVPWELFTLSMASWNAVASLLLVAIWVGALRKS